MNLSTVKLIMMLASAATTLSAQPQQVPAYYNFAFFPGDNLIGNPFDDGTNVLNSILRNGPVPIGSTFTKWDPIANQFLPTSTFLGPSYGWSINYSFTVGEGGILNSPLAWTNTFVGMITLYEPLGTNIWNPNHPAGLYLISDPMGRRGPIDVEFSNIVGRVPQDGEAVMVLNAALQSYTVSTFHPLTGWDNGDPFIGTAQAAWFNLHTVPEPNVLGLGAISLGVLWLFRRKSRH